MQIITKFANGKQSSCKQLNHLIKYITNPKKTNQDFIYGNGLFVDNAFDNMMLVKQLAAQTNGRQYIHWITSFHPDDNISPELAHELGREFASGFNEYQWIMATHTDRNHIHNHYVMNSVNSVTGKKFSQSPGDLEKLKKSIDAIYKQALLLNCTIPEIYEEENDMYDEDYDIWDSNEAIIIDEGKQRMDSDKLSELYDDLKDLTATVNTLAQCMSGYMQICNPQTLSNAISREVERQLNQRFCVLPNSNQKYIQG